jgi:uncharacterized protein
VPEISLGSQLADGLNTRVAPDDTFGHAAGVQIAAHREEPLVRATANATAFVGRALRGPINTAVYVTSVAEYQQIFGGLWQPSPLSYAIEHFFEQGGRRAVVVRVANGAAPASLKIACGSDFLYLEAKAPGTREYLRVSIDYDNIDVTDTERFNLVVQRVRAAGSERIEEQEIFRGLSMDPLAPRFLSLALVESNLVRVRGAIPSARPNSTMTNATFMPVAYIESKPDGDDGAPLTDYDIVGSATRRTGIFALEGIDDIGFVYIPPLSRTQDIGVTALVVATRFCRAHRAILIVDPPATWATAEQALTGMREQTFRSDHALMFYPRINTLDRLRGHTEAFGNGGALAGMLARAEESRPVWALFAPEPEMSLRGSLRLGGTVSEAERVRLVAAGVNGLSVGRVVPGSRRQTRTLAGGASAAADWGYLASLRFAQMVVRSVDRGTRWLATSSRDPAAWAQAVRQIEQFLATLVEAGAFPSAPDGAPYLVVCDERVNSESDLLAGDVHILLQFAALHPGEFHGYMITHSLRGTTIMSVGVNTLRLSNATPDVAGDPGVADDDEEQTLDADDRIPLARFGFGD